MEKKDIIGFFLITLLLISVLTINIHKVNSIPSIEGAWISIAPSNILIGQKGQPLPTPTTTLNVTVANVTNLFAWQIKVYYDPSILLFDGASAAVDPDPSINIFGAQQHLFAPPWVYFDAQGSYVLVGSMLLPPEPGATPSANGSGVLTQLKFRGVSPGSSHLNFSRPYGVDTLLLNMTELGKIEPPGPMPIPAHLVDGSVTVLNPYDTYPPKIYTPTRTPVGDILPNQAVEITVGVTDIENGVKNVTLSYTIDSGTTWTSLMMNYNLTSDLYQATIPGQQTGAWLKYSISAYDNAGNYAKNDNAGSYFVYIVAPEFPPSVILPLLMIATFIAVAVSRRTRKTKNL